MQATMYHQSTRSRASLSALSLRTDYRQAGNIGTSLVPRRQAEPGYEASIGTS